MPQGESVESGSAIFERPDPVTTNNIPTLNVIADDKSVINFNSFNIAQNEAVYFIQPSASASVLSRVTGANASEIAGILSANGTLLFVNQNGVRFTPSAQVNVNSLIASTLDISTNNFVNGNYILQHTLDGVYSQILNEGRITGNNIALVASGVHNAGIIAAKTGIAHLASGDKVTVSFDQKGLIQVEINEQTSGQVVDLLGKTVKDAVANSGTIEAKEVVMSAQTAAGIFENAVNQTGIVKATAITQEGGVIRIRANRNIQVSGTLEAPVGGVFVLSEESIAVKANLNTSGNTNIMADKDIDVSENIATLEGDLSLIADADLDGIGSFRQASGTLISTINYGDIMIQSSGEGSLANIVSAGDLILKQGGAAAVFTQHSGSSISTVGSLSIGRGVTIKAADTLYSIGKDLINLGSFYPQNSKVELISDKSAIIKGSITFNDFKVIVPGKKVNVTAGDMITILGILTLQGSYGDLLTLVSTEPGVQWKILPLGGSDMAYSQIGDCFNARGPPLQAIHSSSLGNNSNFDLDFSWTGQGASYNWSDPDNWDSGTIPSSFDTVTFNGITGTNPNKNSFIDPDFSGTIANFIIDGYTGTITLSRDITIKSDITLVSGTLKAEDHTISVGGNWLNKGGDFQAGTSNVVFFDASQSSLITGNSRFYNFTCLTPTKQLYFEAGKTTTIIGTFKSQGAYAQHVKLLSSEPGKQWYIDPQGARDITYTWVEDSYNLDLDKVVMIESTNRGNCFNWDPIGTWTGAVSNLWSAVGNWSGLGGVFPGAGDDLVFPNGAANLSNINDLFEDAQFNSITFQASGYTLSGSAISMVAGSIVSTNAVGLNTINFDISCSGSLTVTVANAGTLALNGILSGTGALSKEGTGTLALSGVNTYAGMTTVSAGSLRVQNSSVLGTLDGVTSVENGASLILDGNGLSVAERLDTLVGMGVSGLGALRNLANNNTWSGAINLAGDAGVEISSDSGTLTISGGVTGTAIPLYVDGAGNINFTTAPIATNAGTLIKNGAGIATLSFPNTYTGTTTINAGTLRHGIDNAIGSGGVVLTGGTFDLNGYSDAIGALTMTGGSVTTGVGVLRLGGDVTTNATNTTATITGNLDLGGATRNFIIGHGTAPSDYDLVISAIISSDSGTYGITKQGAGTLVLSGANTYTGLTTVSAGVLNIQNDTALGSVITGTTVANGACLQVQGGIHVGNESLTLSGTGISLVGALRNILNDNFWQSDINLGLATRIASDSGTFTFDGAIYGGYALTIGGAGNMTLNDVIGTGANTLTKYGTGTLTLTAANTYSGATSVNEGTLILSGSGSAVNSAFTVQNGGTLTLDNSAGAVDRLGDQLTLTLTGGNFNFIGSPTGSVAGLIGSLTISSGFNTVTVTPGAGGSTTLTFLNFIRTANAGATIVFRGTNLGSTPGPGVSTLIFASDPALTGGGGDAGTPTVSIIKGAFGDASLTGTGTDMVTYNVGNANGLRLLNGAGFTNEYLLNSFATTNANVRLTAATPAATATINSLIIDSGGSITDAGQARVLTFANTEHILSLPGNSGINGGVNTTLAFGAVEPCIFTNGDLTIAGVITGSAAAGLVKEGLGVLTLSAQNLYTGTTIIDSGTLLYGINNAILSGAVTIYNATYDLNGYSDLIGALNMTGGSVTTGAGVLTLGGDVTSNVNDTAATISGNLDLGAATRQFIINDGLPVYDMVVSAVISSATGVYGITKTTAGGLILSGANTYTGITTITGGTLSVAALANGGSNSNIGASSSAEVCLIINGGTFQYTGGSVSIDRLFSIGTSSGTIDSSGSGALTFNNTGAMGLPGAGARTLTITGSNDLVLAAFISDNGGATTIIKNGNGNFTLSNANAYTGTATINAGILTIQNSSALGSSVAGCTTSIVSGATLQIDGNNLNIAEPISSIIGSGFNNVGALRNLANNNTWSGTIVLGAAGAIITTDADNLTITGVISAAQPLTKNGAGTLTLSALNTYTGLTTVNAGTLSYGVNNALSSGAVTVSGGIFDINTHFDTVGAVTLTSGSITGTTGVLTGTSYTVEDGLISAILAGGIGLTKNTGGTVTITNGCSYTGATTISGGTLIFSGVGSAVTSSSFTINYNATLTLDNSAQTGIDRIGDSVGIAMNGGYFNFIGNPVNPSYGRMGVLTINAGLNTVTVTPGAGGATVLTFASLSKTAGAEVIFRGTDFGLDPAANVSTLLFVTAPTLTGGAGAAGTTIVSIIRGAFGDNSLDGRGTDMVTYNVGNSNGLRLLNGAGFTGEYLLNWFGTANANVKLTESTTAITGTINSLIVATGGSVSDAGVARTLTLTTGNILSFAGNAGINGVNTIVAFGAAEACILNRGDLIVSAVINGTGGLTKAGSGVLMLSAANTYTGVTNIGSGTLRYGVNDAILTGNVTVFNATYDLNGHTDTIGALAMTGGSVTTGGGKLTLNGDVIGNANLTSAYISGNLDMGSATRTFTIASTVGINDMVISAVVSSGSGAFGIIKAGAGTLVLSGANTYTGTTTINVGVIDIQNNTALGTTLNGTTVAATGAALQLENGITVGVEALSLTGTGVGAAGALRNILGDNTWQGLITLGNTTTIASDNDTLTLSGGIAATTLALTITGAGNITVSGATGITGTTATLTKSGAGTLTISAPGTYQGLTTVSAGVLNIQNATATGTTAGGVSVTSGAAVQLQGNINVGAESLTLNGTGISLTGALRNISGNNRWQGGIVLNAASRINSDGGLLTLSGAITTANALTVGGISNTEISGNITTAGITLIKDGTGTLTLSSATGNGFTGQITLNSGTLELGVSSTLSANPLTINNGIFDIKSFSDSIGTVILVAGTINGTTGVLSSSATFDVRSGTINAILGGAVGLTKTTTGTVVLTGANSYTGVTTISAGNLSVSSLDNGGLSSNIGASNNAAANLVINNTGTLLYTGGVGSTDRRFTFGAGTTGCTINNSGTGALSFTNTNSLTSSGAASILILRGSDDISLASIIPNGTGVNVLTKIGPGRVILTAANTYTGATNVIQGVLNIQNATATGTVAGGVVVSSGAQLQMQGGITVGTEALTLNGTGINDDGALRSTGGANIWQGAVTLGSTAGIGTDNGTGITISGVISGAYSLIKFGVGTLTFTGAANANTYSGTTYVMAGELDLSKNAAVNAFAGPLVIGDGFGGANADIVKLINANQIPAVAVTIYNSGKLDLNGLAESFGALNMTGGTVATGAGTLTLTADITTNADASSATISGNLALGASRTFTVADGAAADDLLISAIISGATFGITKAGSGNLNLTGADSYDGSTLINAGTVTISGSGSATGTAFTVNYGAALILDNTATTGIDRLGAAKDLTINGGEFKYTGNGSAQSNESTGALILNNGFNIVTCVAAAGGQTVMTFTSITRNNAATVLFRGTNLGANEGAGNANIKLGAPALVGGGGAAGSTTISILPYAIGDTSATGSGIGFVTNNVDGGGNDNGIRPLNLATEYTNSANDGSTQNVRLIASASPDATRSWNSLLLDGAGVTYTIGTSGSKTMTITSGAICSSGSAANTIAGGTNFTLVASAGTPEFKIFPVKDLTISAVISNTNTPTLCTGTAGILILSGANLYTGLTTINSTGTLRYGINDALANGNVAIYYATYDLNTYIDTIGTLTMTGGSVTTGTGKLTLGGDVTGNAALTSATISGNLDMGGATRTFTIASTAGINDMVISAVIGSVSGAYGITKSGAGTLVLTGTNTFTGTTTVNVGVLNIQNVLALGTILNGTSVASGAALQIQGGITVGTEALTLVGTGISNDGALRNISGNNIWQGAIAIGNGATRINSDSGLITLSGNLTIPNAITLSVGGAGNTQIDGIVGTAAVAAILTKDGAGTLTLTNANIYTGATNVSAGVLNIRNATATGTTGGGVVLTSGAQLQIQGGIIVGAEALTLIGGGINNDGALRNISGDNIWQGAIAIGNGATRINSNSGLLTLSGNVTIPNAIAVTVGGWGNTTISGILGTAAVAATLTKDGPGTLILNNANIYTGATTVSWGILNIRNDTALGTTAVGTTVAAGAQLQMQGGITVGAEALTLNGFGINNDGALRNVINDNAWGAGAITLGSATRINSDSGLLTISGAFSGANTLTIGGAANTTFSGVIGTGAGTLTKDGSGTLTLSGIASNTYTGATTVIMGELDLNKTATVDAFAGPLIIGDGIGGANADVVKLLAANQIPAVAITIYNSGLLNLNGVPDTIGSLTMTGGSITTGVGTLTLGGDVIGNANTTSATISGNLALGATRTFSIYDGAASDDMAISAVISGSFGITKAGGGTLYLSGLNTYTLVTTVSAGILEFNSIADRTGIASALGAPANANNGTIAFGTGTLLYTGSGHSTNRVINLTAAGTIDASGSGTLTLTGGVTSTFNLILTGSGNANVTTNAIANGTGTVTKNGNGTWTFSVANSYTGLTIINAGTLTFGIADAIAAGAVTINAGTFNLNGFSDTIAALTMAGGSITTGAGTLTMNGDFTGNASSSAATISGIIDLGTATRTFTLNDDLTISAVINSAGGARGIIKAGVGILTLSAANGYTGPTTVSAGILKITNSIALGTVLNGTSVTAGAQLQLQGGLAIGAETLTLNGSGIANTGALRNLLNDNTWGAGAITLGSATRINSDSGTLSLSGAFGGVGMALTVGGAGSTTLNGAVNTGAAGALTKDGSGTLTLMVASNYTGATTISAGAVNIRNATSTGTVAGGVTVAYGACLQIQGGAGITVGTEQLTLIGPGVAGTGTLRNISGANVWQGAISLINNAFIAIDGGSLNLSGIISGSGAVTKNGVGTLILSGANTFTGNVAVNDGTLQLLTNPLNLAGRLTVSGGTFDANGLATTVAGLVTINGGTYLAKAGTQTFNGGLTVSSGAFTGAGGIVTVNGNVTISGTGTLTAPSGAFNVSGNWTNSGGTFTSGSGSNTVTFNGGSATIEPGGIGNGQAFNNVTINTTGTKTIASPIMIAGDLLMTSGIFAGDSNVTVTGGDVTGGGTITMTDGTFNLRTAGSFGGTGADWTFFNLTFGDNSLTATTTKGGTNATTVTGTLSVLTNHTLSAGTSTWNLTWTAYLKTIRMISSGYDHTIALTQDGDVFSWGNNELGQLGDGTLINRSMPVQVLGEGGVGYLSGIASIAAGGYHSVALASDGSVVYTWGYNNSGQLGNNTTTDSLTPVKVHGVGNFGDLSNIASIAAGGWNTAAVSTTGFVYTWGYNADGELGNDSTVNSLVPVQVLSGEQGNDNGIYLHSISSVAVGGSHMLALGLDGSVYAWGFNGDGELGNTIDPAPLNDSHVPVKVLAGEQLGGDTYLHNITQISAGEFHSVALSSSGFVYCWGYNNYGQLGNNTTNDAHVPVRVLSGAQGGGVYLQNVTSISAGDAHTLAIADGGYVYSWGQNRGPEDQPWGQLGDGTTIHRSSPVKVHGENNVGFLTGISSIAAGGAQTVAVNQSLRVFNCGNNKDGQLGIGNTVAQVGQIRVQAGSQAGPAISHTPITGGGTITGTPNINFSDFYHINIILNTGIFTVGFTNLTLGGSGTYSLNHDINVFGNLVINNATLSAGTYGIVLSGNWTNNNGTFNAGSGTVTLNSTTQTQSITSGGSAFNILTVTNTYSGGAAFVDRLVTAYLNAGSGVKKLSFSAASSSQPHTITTSFNVSGSAGNLIELAPLVAATTWYIATPTSTLHHLKVSYSNNVNSQPIIATSSTDQVPGSNTNWSITP